MRSLVDRSVAFTKCHSTASTMKRILPSALFGLFVCLCCIPPASAQWRFSASPEPRPDVLSPEPRRLYLGFFAGLNLNEHPGTFRPDRCDECVFNDGSGKGVFLGAQLEYLFQPFIGVALKVALDDKRADYTTPLPSRKRIVIDETTGQPDSNVILDFERQASVLLSYVTINPMVEVFPLKNLYLMGGIALGVPVRKNYSVKERALDPNVRFWETGTSEVIYRDESEAEVQDVKTRLDARVGAGYNIRISPVVLLAPEVMYEFPLSTIAAEPNWKAQSIHILAVLKITL